MAEEPKGSAAPDSPYKDEKADKKPPKPAPLTVSESDAQYAVQLARFGGNHEMLARQLWGEQLTSRRRNREIREERDALRSRNPQGSVVLIGEDVTRFNAWKALGEPTDLKAKLDSLATMQDELATAKRTATRAAAAKALKWKPALLNDRLDVEKLDVEVREEPDAQGKKQPVAYARKSADAPWEKLAAVAERDWSEEHRKALQDTSTPVGSPAPNAAPLGLPFPNNGAGSAAAGSVVDRFIANRDAAQAQRPKLGAKGTQQKTA